MHLNSPNCTLNFFFLCDLLQTWKGGGNEWKWEGFNGQGLRRTSGKKRKGEQEEGKR